MKKRICLFLALVMLLSCAALPASAQQDVMLTTASDGFSISGFAIGADNIAVSSAEGDFVQWTIPDNAAGDVKAAVYLTAGSTAEAIVTTAGTATHVDLYAPTSGEYEIGMYTFAGGDTVRIVNRGTTGVVSLRLTALTETFLDTSTVTFSLADDWASSGAPGFNTARGYYARTGVASAEWKVPAGVSGVTDVYYYVPDVNKTGYADMANIVTANYGNKQTRVWTFGGKTVESGWKKLGTVTFSGSGDETITVTKSEDYPGCAARLYGIKFVSNTYEGIMITPDNFVSTGSWQRESNSGAFEERVLRYYTAGDGDAIYEAKVPNGNYYVYVHSCDFGNYFPSTRTFKLNINGTTYTKNASGKQMYFGTHQYPGNPQDDDSKAVATWDWEQAASPYKILQVTDGKIRIAVQGVTNNARLDAILLTRNPIYTIEDISVESTKTERFPIRGVYDDDLVYPESYKESMTDVQQTAVLSNDKVTVSFKQGILANGNAAVQRQTAVGDVITNTYESGLGFLSMRADKATKQITNGYYPNFSTEFLNKSGEMYKISSENIFRVAAPEWLIPTTLEQLSNSSVKMTASGETADITAVWTLEDGDLEPKVDVSVHIKKAGEYTFGFFNDVNEVEKSKVGYVLNPFRWQESRLPKSGQLITEAQSTTAHTQMTYKADESGREVTLGVAADQSAIAKNRWVRDLAVIDRTDVNGNPIHLDYTDAQSNFAMNTTGNDGGVLPAIFAPVLCSEDSAFSAGDTYSFSYRPLATVSTEGENRGWYTCYKHVAEDLRGVYDFRDNYYDSMTNTVFNIYNLLLDDEQGGWNKDLVGNYNIEDTYWVTDSNGLAYLQFYMLTEDKDMLMNRTLPIMGTLLTRNSPHLNSRYSHESRQEGPINKFLTKTDFTGNSTYEGAYLMSRGQMPIFRNIAKNGLKNTYVEGGGRSFTNPSEALWYDRARGDTSLSTTIAAANSYLNNRSFISATNANKEETFINIAYNPHFQSQMDAYEATGNEDYLRGAVEAARRFLPSLKTTDMPDSKTDMKVANVDLLDGEARLHNKHTWWWFDTGYRRGATMTDAPQDVDNGSVYYRKIATGAKDDALIPDTTPYPEWVTSRVGLGLEQFSTCSYRSSNIFMSTWAGDILRLGYLSNDELMMDMARSSIVGRSANYPGYYISNYNPVVGDKNYPILGFDSTSFYFHHIPVYLSALEDYLFSNAWVKSDGKVDFPNTRSQGYAWFNNRQYGHEAGTIYDETNMWPWLKEGTITVSSKQIDWIAGRKDGRAAFVLTNAGDEDETVTVSFNADLGITSGSNAAIYDKAGNKTSQKVSDNKISVTVPKKGILTVAVSGTGIEMPAYARIDFDASSDGNDLDMENSAMGLMYRGNTYSESTGYDVKAYALSLDPESYMAYIFVGGRSTDTLGGDGDNGIVKTTLKWRYSDETEYKTVTDDSFPYEFFIPVDDKDRNIVFNVKTDFKNGSKNLGKEYTLSKYKVSMKTDKTNFEPVSLSILNAAGSVTPPLTTGKSKYCIAYKDINKIPIDVSYPDALEGCYLNGYLVAKDLKDTDIVESGYVLFNNVKIVNSAINPSSNNRFDFSVADILMGDRTKCEEYDENGNYLGVKQGIINVTNGALVTYDWSNLYITNSKTQPGLQCIQNGNTYTISCDTAEYVYVVKAAFDSAGRMTSVSAEDAIISVNNPKVVTVADNEKVFVWKDEMYKGTNLQPIIEELTKQK